MYIHICTFVEIYLYLYTYVYACACIYICINVDLDIDVGEARNQAPPTDQIHPFPRLSLSPDSPPA